MGGKADKVLENGGSDPVHQEGMGRRGFLRAVSLLATAPVMSGCERVQRAVEFMFGEPSNIDVELEPDPVKPTLVKKVEEIEKPKKFNFREYQPVEGGQIVDSHLESPDAKTVIFFADEHPGPTADDSLVAEFRHYQLSTFGNVSDLVSRYGRVDLAKEMSTADVTAEELREIEGEDVADIRRVARTADPKEREQLGRELVGRTYTNTAGAFLIAAYPDQVNSIPVYTYEELREANKWDGQIRDIVVAADHQDQLPCMNDSSMSLAKAKKLMGGKGARAKKALECFCQVHHAESDAIGEFARNRHVDAPRKEVDAALKGKGEFAVLIAGSLHLAEAVRYMKERGVNYIVVAPSGEEEEVRKYLAGVPKMEALLAPDPKGVCAGTRAQYDAFMEKKEAEARRARAKALREWMMEE